jgi:hypothetical protein
MAMASASYPIRAKTSWWKLTPRTHAADVEGEGWPDVMSRPVRGWSAAVYPARSLRP